MAKIFKLPESAFKCEGQEQVAGHVFKDGQLVVSDDNANLIFRKLVNFYGCTVEEYQVEEEQEEDSEEDDEASLEATKTQE